MNEVELSIFRKELRKIFYIYDEDNSGTLDNKELKKLVDDLRISMFLPPADKKILEKIFALLDKSEDDLIELSELLKSFREIYQVLIEPGSEMEEIIKEDFEEMDFDDSGALEREELLPLFQRICQREN
jgi:Ca2+-binding EF-hand superfamily protein